MLNYHNSFTLARIFFHAKVIRMTKLPLLVLGSIGMTVISSCVNTNTPQHRIEQNPQVYNKLPASEQKLVSEGHIEEGMSPEAVFLAWGYPNTTPFKGTNKGQNIMRWVYTQPYPVLTTTNWAGPQWGPYGWYDPMMYNNSSTTFIPRNSATVTFENNKVVSWETQNKTK